jgi:hypothetical protein
VSVWSEAMIVSISGEWRKPMGRPIVPARSGANGALDLGAAME